MSALPHSSPRSLGVEPHYWRWQSDNRRANRFQGIRKGGDGSDHSENRDAHGPPAIQRPSAQHHTHIRAKHFHTHDFVEIDIADQACVDIFDCVHSNLRLAVRRIEPPVAILGSQPKVVSAHELVCQGNVGSAALTLSTAPTIGGLTKSQMLFGGAG